MNFNDLKIGMKVCMQYGTNEFISTITAFDTRRKSFRVDNPPVWFFVENINIEKTRELNRTTDKTDNIKPNHYRMNINGVDIETRDIMQAVATEEEYNGFLYCNVIKYILRAKRKNGIEDMKKAKLYLEWLIEEKEK